VSRVPGSSPTDLCVSPVADTEEVKVQKPAEERVWWQFTGTEMKWSAGPSASLRDSAHVGLLETDIAGRHFKFRYMLCYI
jgi:hypothetical protein